MTPLNDLQSAIGHDALLSLSARGLLPLQHSDAAGVVPDDRAVGMLVGIAVGNALGRADIPTAPSRNGGDRSGSDWMDRAQRRRHHRLEGPARRTLAEAQLAHQAARAWSTAGWEAPIRLSDEIVRRASRLRSPGQAVLATVQNRCNGTPWFEAGVASYGNGAATRAFAPAIRFANDPEARTFAAAVDAAVTHATPLATAGAAFLADTAVMLATRPSTTTVATVIREAVAHTDGLLRDHLDAGLAAPLDHDALERLGLHPSLPSTLSVLCCVLTHIDDPVLALAALATVEGDSDTIAAIGGGLLGAAHGTGWIPEHWTHAERAGRLASVARDLRAVASKSTARPHIVSDDPGNKGEPHLWFLLDRSSSMHSIRDDVEGGFDAFFADQRTSGADLTCTVVQFDDQDPHDVLVDRRPLEKVPTIAGRFEPRGMTPLYDAIERLLDVAETSGVHDADQLVVIFTDGHENASKTDARTTNRRIGRLRNRGWTFVFLGANQDAFDVAHGLGMARTAGRNVDADSDGVRKVYGELSHATANWRAKPRSERLVDRDGYWNELTHSRRR